MHCVVALWGAWSIVSLFLLSQLSFDMIVDIDSLFTSDDGLPTTMPRSHVVSARQAAKIRAELVKHHKYQYATSAEYRAKHSRRAQKALLKAEGADVWAAAYKCQVVKSPVDIKDIRARFHESHV
eukprot:gnl/Ergobibamus_cyprinoides/1763.p3 GENE.gnl/Ergobibamus_cyprinoides/1763~~gnl/Ergobibamus_cyprinoides/1763.p3  ORF type:complete len:125 (+),score=48.17 gnl/Ergobibamus_cyprinoides/1763:616-990(+)